MLESLTDESDRDLLTRIAFREEPEKGPTVDDCVSAFRRQRLMREGRKLRDVATEVFRRGLAESDGPAVLNLSHLQ